MFVFNILSVNNIVSYGEVIMYLGSKLEVKDVEGIYVFNFYFIIFYYVSYFVCVC